MRRGKECRANYMFNNHSINSYSSLQLFFSLTPWPIPLLEFLLCAGNCNIQLADSFAWLMSSYKSVGQHRLACVFLFRNDCMSYLACPSFFSPTRHRTDPNFCHTNCNQFFGMPHANQPWTPSHHTSLIIRPHNHSLLL
jgi:hypothetical protein